MRFLEGMDPVAWVFIAVALVGAVGFGVLLDVGTTVGSYLLRREQRRQATVVERTKAVGQLVDSPGYGRHAVADPEPTVPIAGSELPPRFGVVLASDPPIPVLQDEPLLLPKAPPSSEQQDRRSDDDPSDGPPAGGGTARPETLVMPRYPWAHLNGEKLEPPGPWRAPIDWLQHVATRAVMVWHLDSHAGRVLYRLRLSLTKLWAYQIRYAAAGQHDAMRLCRRSWLEIADERREAAERLRASWPGFGCVPR